MDIKSLRSLSTAARNRTFEYLSRVNRDRCAYFNKRAGKTVLKDGEGIMRFALGAAGEVGELANIVNKIDRLDKGFKHNNPGDLDRDELVVRLADEIGDVFLYLDLVAFAEGIDLFPAIVNKFNKTSVIKEAPHQMSLMLDEYRVPNV